MRLLLEINRNRGAAIVMVTHNRNIIREYPARVFVCEDNKCHEQTTDEAE